MNKLSHFRKQQNIAQPVLGALLVPPIKQAAVSMHERGERTPDVYQAIQYARALGVSVEELFPLTDVHESQAA